MIRLDEGMLTEDVGVFEVDGFILERVGGVEEGLSCAVELDGVGRLVDAVGLDHHRLFFQLLSDHSHVLLVHVLDVVHRHPRSVGQMGLQQLLYGSR